MNSKYAVTTSSSVALVAVQKSYLCIENLSDTDVRVRLDEGSDAVTLPAGSTPGIGMKAAGGKIVLSTDRINDPALANAIRVIHGGSGTKDISITYW